MTEQETTVLGTVNAGARFLLEVAALGILGYWGYSVGQTQVVKLSLGVGIALMVASVWGLFGSPAAPYRLGYPLRLGLEVAILGGAASALYLLDQPTLSAVFAVSTVLNITLLYLLDQT